MTDSEKIDLLTGIIIQFTGALIEVRGMILQLSQQNFGELNKSFDKSVKHLQDVLDSTDKLL